MAINEELTLKNYYQGTADSNLKSGDWTVAAVTTGIDPEDYGTDGAWENISGASDSDIFNVTFTAKGTYEVTCTFTLDDRGTWNSEDDIIKTNTFTVTVEDGIVAADDVYVKIQFRDISDAGASGTTNPFYGDPQDTEVFTINRKADNDNEETKITNLTKDWLESYVEDTLHYSLSVDRQGSNGETYTYYGTSLDQDDISLLVGLDDQGQKQILIHEFNGQPVTRDNPIVLEVYYQSKANLSMDVTYYDYEVTWDSYRRNGRKVYYPTGINSAKNYNPNESYKDYDPEKVRFAIGGGTGAGDTHNDTDAPYRVTKSMTNTRGYGDNSRVNVNEWTTTNDYQVIQGIVSGLDESGNPIFTMDAQKHLFDTVECIGKTLDSGSLTFKWTGLDTYTYGVGNNDFYTYQQFRPLGGKNDFFGMRLEAEFTVPENYDLPLTYTFKGDDDLWVFIDGVLVLDIGGKHNAIEGTVDLETGRAVVTVGERVSQTQMEDPKEVVTYYDVPELRDGEKHTITVLYMERGGNVSNCDMTIKLPNLTPLPSEVIPVDRPWPVLDKTVSAGGDTYYDADREQDAVEIQAGEEFTYQIKVQNAGGQKDDNVVVTDTLPTGMTYVFGNTAKGTVSENDGHITWTVGELDPNESATLIITAKAPETTSIQKYRNTATVVDSTAKDDAWIVVQPNLQELTFTKTWSGGTAESINVTVAGGGNTYYGTGIAPGEPVTFTRDTSSAEATVQATVTDNKDGTWTVKVSGLPAVADGYTVTETAVNGESFDVDGKAQVDADKDGINEGYWTKESDGNNITNTYTQNIGSLTVTKTVEKKYPVSDDIPTGEKFSITVTLGNGSAGAQTVTENAATYVANGVYTFSLANSESATITDIPYGTSYAVKEALTTAQTEKGYSYKSGEVTSDKIDAAAETVTILNQYYKSPKISVRGTKTWVSAGYSGNLPSVTITLSANGSVTQKTPSWTGNTYTFSDLDQYDANGELINYTVAETGVFGTTNVDGKFVVYDTSVHTQDQTGVHKYKAVGYWKSEKTQDGFKNTWVPAGNEYSGEYGFTVQKVDETGEVIDDSTEATFTLTNPDGSTQDYTTTDGVATIGGLTDGTYKLKEKTAPQGYEPTTTEWTVEISKEGQLLKVEEKASILTNIWNWIFGASADKTDGYTWNGNTNTLSVTNTKIMGKITVSKTVVDGDGDPLRTDGKFTFEVKNSMGDVVDTLEVTTSSSATTEELPYGTYTITETGKADISDYTWSNVTYSGDDVTTQNGVTTVSVTSQDQQIQVAAENTYTRDTGTLIIEKMIPVADMVAVNGATGYSGTITAASEEKTQHLTFNASNFGASAATKTVDGVEYKVYSQTYPVPTGSYTITESGADIANYYRTTNVNGTQIYGTGATVTSATVTVNTTNTVEAPATVTVTNDYEIHTHDLSIEKTVSKTSNSVNAPADAAFTFTVKLGEGNVTVPDEAYKDVGADYVENGSYTFTLKANEEAVIKGIPYGVAYEVTETNIPEGFVSDWTDNKFAGTMPDDALELSCTNTYFKSETINLTVEKTWSGSDDYQGTVTVELWKNNAATGQTRTLSASNWSASFNDLPLYDGRNDGEINTYTVHETAVENTTLENGRFIVYGDHTVANSDPEVREVLGFWTSNIPDAVSETSTLTITNTWTPAANAGTGKFTVQKHVTGTTTPLAGVKFTLSGDALNGDREGYTNDAGQVTFDALPAGTYTLTESVPTGYSANTTTYTIKVGDEDEEGNALVRVDEDTSTSNVFTNIWNWVVNNVTGGTKIGVDGTLTVYNTKVTGTAYSVPDTITITKTDGAKEAITSDTATFTLTDDKNGETRTATTNGSGVATFTFGGKDGISITDGNTVGTVTKTYTLTETDAPAGYDPKTGALGTVTVTAETEEVLKDGKFVLKTTYTATIDGEESTEVTNTKKTTDDYRDATLTITKTDGGTEKLKGATFTLTGKDGTQYDTTTHTTDENGQILLTFGNGKIPEGTYTLTETVPPTGFSLGAKNEWIVTVRDDDVESYYDTYTKVDDSVVTDTYVTVHTYKVSVDSAAETTAATLPVTNTRNSYTVTVQKIVTGETDALPANFQIHYESQGSDVSGDLTISGMELTTGSNGEKIYTWKVPLPYGKTFSFTEENYTATGYYVTYKANGVEQSISASIPVSTKDNRVTFENHYEKQFDENPTVNPPVFTIQKTDKATGAALGGAEFILTNANGVTVWRGVVPAEGMKITIGNQYLEGGTDETKTYTFTLTETLAPNGYTKDGTNWTVTVNHNGDVVIKRNDETGIFHKIYTWIVSAVTGDNGASYVAESKTLTVTNTRDLGTLTISKEVTGVAITDTDAWAEVRDMVYTFQIQAGSDIVKDVADKTFGSADFNVSGMATVKVKDDQTLKIEKLPTGSYTITEVTSGDGIDIGLEHYKAPTVTINGENTNEKTMVVFKNVPTNVNVVNNYEKENSKATLTVEKEVMGVLNGGQPYDLSVEAAGKDYTFQITGENVYGETVDQTVTVTGADTKTVDLVYGNYTVTEVTGNISQIDGYTWSGVEYGENTFTLGKDGYEITATNTYTRDTNDLSIQKFVIADTRYEEPDATTDKVYKFTISGPAGTGSYTATGSMTEVNFTNGKATVELKADDTLKIENLPTGRYTVTEVAESAVIDANQTDWTWTPTTAQTADLTSGAENLVFNNAYIRNTGDLEITKTVAGDGADLAKNKTYTFTITAPEALNGSYETSVSGVTASFDGGTTATVSVTLNNSTTGSITVYDLPTGNYTVEEQDLDDHDLTNYDLEVSGGDGATVTTDGTAEVGVTNTYNIPSEKPTQELTVTKTVTGLHNNDAAGKIYTFRISGNDIYGQPLLANKQTVEVTIDAGSDTGSTIVELPRGSYTVTEVTDTLNTTNSVTGYTWQKVYFGENENADEAIADLRTSNGYVAATNVYDRDEGSLKIGKTVSGADAPDSARTTKEYTFTVSTALTDVNGTYTVTYADESDRTTEEIRFLNGEATVTIQGVGNATIAGLPTGAYTVTEDEDAAEINYYTLTVTGNNANVTVPKSDTGAVTIDNSYSETFVNQTPAKLTVKKTVLDADTEQPIATTNTYNFKVKGTTVYNDPYENTVSGVPVGDTGVTIELPYGTYTVTELTPVADIVGYTYVDVEFDKDATFTVTNLDTENGSNQYTITATNVYDRDFGSLSITKKVEGLVDTDKDAQLAIDSMVYTFKVTGPADAVTRYQGEDIDFTLDAGGTTASGEVIITGEDTLILTDLPAGPYTVTEITEGKDIDLTYYNGPVVSGDHNVPQQVKQGQTATQFTITNTYTPKKDDVPKEVTAELTITKNIKDGSGEALNVPEGESKTYYFQVVGIDVYGTPVLDLPIVELEVQEGANTITTAEPIKLIYGDYAVTEVDANGKPITVDNVAGFTGYTWNETESVTATAAAIHLDDDSKTDSFTATNVYDRDLTDLTVTKIFKDISEADIERLESFKLTVAGPADFNGGDAKELKLSDSGVKKTYTQGKHVTYTWTLKDVPTGDYTVTENRKDIKLAEYSMTVKGSVNNSALDVIQANEDNFVQAVKLEKGVDSAVTFQNAYKRQTGDLTITKKVVGDKDDEGKLPDGAADTQVYTFTITGPADVMNYGENGTYKSGTVVFAPDEGGQTASATVTITGEGSKTIPGLPTGTYTVTEDKVRADVEYWELDVTGEGSVEVTNNGTTEVTVTNTYTREVPPVTPPEDQPVTLTITKVVKDSRGGDLTALAAGKEYYFRIIGEDVYDAISLERCVNGRRVLGGPAPENVRREAARVLSLIEEKEGK